MAPSQSPDFLYHSVAFKSGGDDGAGGQINYQVVEKRFPLAHGVMLFRQFIIHMQHFQADELQTGAL